VNIEPALEEDLQALHDDEDPKPKTWFKTPLSDEELAEIRAAKANELLGVCKCPILRSQILWL
jgi:hypothetical protein